jgi:protein ImuB
VELGPGGAWCCGSARHETAVRVACGLVQDLPLAAALRASPELVGLPLAVVSGAGPRAEVVAASPEAARRGVRRLASTAHARAACAELCVRVASPALERAAREALLDASLGLSPRAALAPPSAGAYAGEAAVYVDASGVGSLHRSEAGFATALGVAAQKLGLPAVATVAGSRSVAHLLARGIARLGPGAARVLPPGGEVELLSPLPIDLLDPGDELAEALTRYGVRTLGELLALPRRALATRLGKGVLPLVALARGDPVEAQIPAPARGRLIEAIDLDFAIDREEPLVFVLQGLLSRLVARLDARALACAGLVLRLDLERGGRDERRVGLAAPSADLRALVRLARHALEARPPRAAVVGARVEAEASPLQRDQLDLFRPAGPAPAALGRTLAELEVLCGAGRVGAPALADDHRPGAFALLPFQGLRSPEVRPGSPAVRLGVRALRPPVRAQVTPGSGGPAFVRSAVANGRVLHVAGPWRTTGGWWSPEERFAYDSFDVQTSDGTLARLRYDHRSGVWEIDAIYD